jgi:predicted membrane chloride channel (bestrophin family)
MNVETLQGTPEGARDNILSDHEDLREMMRGLEQHLWQATDLDREWLTTLRKALHDFAEACRAHFRDEERGGLHLQLRDRSPRLAFRLQQLVYDHPRILVALQELVADFPPDEAMKPNELRSLKERVQSALEVVHAHERAETEITMDAYWDDLGGEGD